MSDAIPRTASELIPQIPHYNDSTLRHDATDGLLIVLIRGAPIPRPGWQCVAGRRGLGIDAGCLESLRQARRDEAESWGWPVPPPPCVRACSACGLGLAPSGGAAVWPGSAGQPTTHFLVLSGPVQFNTPHSRPRLARPPLRPPRPRRQFASIDDRSAGRSRSKRRGFGPLGG